MAISLNDNIQIRAPKPTDSRYLSPLSLPYTGVPHVCTLIPVSERHIGLTVNIRDVEYWFESGTSDSDLVAKNSTGVANPSFCRVLLGGEPNQVNDPFKRETIVPVGTPISGSTKFFWMFCLPDKVQANSIAIRDVTNGTYIATGLSTNNYNQYNAGVAEVDIGNISNAEPMTHIWLIELKNIYGDTVQSSQLKISSV